MEDKARIGPMICSRKEGVKGGSLGVRGGRASMVDATHQAQDTDAAAVELGLPLSLLLLLLQLPLLMLGLLGHDSMHLPSRCCCASLSLAC